MFRWATDDQYERETDETDRLIHPAPKIKPPRRDKRREDVRPERDPDIDDDPDIAKDPDMSMNYKNIGGSVLARRVVARFQRESKEFPSQKALQQYMKDHPDADPSMHSVKEKEEDKSKEDEPKELSPHLKIEDPGERKEFEDKDKKPKGEAHEEEEGLKGEKPKDLASAGKELLEAAKTDKDLKRLLDSLGDKAGMGAVLNSTPEMKLEILPQLKDKKLPAGVKTLGDLSEALSAAQAAPAEEKPKGKGKAPKGLVKVKHKETGRELEVKPEVLEANPEEYEKAKPALSEHAEIKDTKEDKDSQAKRIVEKFKSEKKDADPAWLAHVDELPTTTKDKDGTPLFYDKKTKGAVPFDKLPAQKQSELIAAYEKTQAEAARADDFQKKLQGNGKAREAVESLFDPESDLSQKLTDLKKKGYESDDLPVEKNIPELAGLLPRDVQSVGDLQKFVQANPDVFRKQTSVGKWVKEKGPESKEFQEYAKSAGGEVDAKTGKLVFPKGKKKVPWDKLDDDAKEKLYQGFQDKERVSKWTESVNDIARSNVDVSVALRQLGNPRDEVAQKLSDATSLQDPKLLKLLPALKDVSLPEDMTFGDLVSISKEAFKPVAPPKRPEPSPEDQRLAMEGFRKTFKDRSALSALIEMSNPHPHDIMQIVREFEAAKKVKLKPDEIDDRIAELRKKGLYTSDPESVLPPKSGMDKNGTPTSWDKLDDDEKSVAFAAHKNSVLAASLALRDQVIQAYTDNGLPPNIASVLAACKLSARPGESPKDRAKRSIEVAKKSFQSTLQTNDPPQDYSEDSIKKALESAGDDPLAKNLLVAHFQANDYLKARDKYLTTKGTDQIDERDNSRNIAARLRDASEELRRSDKQYPAENRHQNTADMFRKRVLTRLMALHPKKAAEIEPETQKMAAEDWDAQKAEFDKQNKEYKKAISKYQKELERAQKEMEAEQKGGKSSPEGAPYRSMPVVKSVQQRLTEAGVVEPLPPPELPDQPAGYDQVRKSPRAQAQSGKTLWNRLRSMLPGKSASIAERVAGRFLAFSSCEPERSMASSPSGSSPFVTKTGLYWGVDPLSKGKAVNVPYTPWQQAHARDLGETDFKNLLAAAREWMKVPVLARVLDEKDSLGAVHDIQLRAALDLAIRDHDGGKYSVGLHPAVYNDLLARLAGKSSTETIFTQREARASVYSPAPGEDQHMNAASKIRKMAADIANQHPDLAFDLTNLAFEVQAGEMPPALKEHMEEKKKEEAGGDQGQQDQGQQKQASSNYTALRTAIIRTAAQNPAVRPALIPVLQMIKQQGG